jgi:hypothetical protein
VRAAKEAVTVLAEEAALMAEVLVNVALATTIIAIADADNSRQQTTIINRLGAKPCLVVATTEVVLWRQWQLQRQRRHQQ